MLLLILVGGCAAVDEDTVYGKYQKLTVHSEAVEIHSPHNKPVDNLAFSRSGLEMVSVGVNGLLVNWKISGSTFREANSYSVPIDGRFSVSQFADRVVKWSNTNFLLIDTSTSAEISRGNVPWKFDQTAFVHSASVSPDGRLFAALTSKGLHLYGLPSFKLQSEVDIPVGINAYGTNDLVWVSDGLVLASYRNAFVRPGLKRRISPLYHWDAKSGKIWRIEKAGNHNALIASHEQAIVSLSGDAFLTVYDVSNDQIISRFPTPNAQDGSLIAVNPQFDRVAIGLNSGDVVIVSLRTKTEEFILRGNGMWPSSLRFSPDGKILVSGLPNGKLLKWDVSLPLVN